MEQKLTGPIQFKYLMIYFDYSNVNIPAPFRTGNSSYNCLLVHFALGFVSIKSRMYRLMRRKMSFNASYIMKDRSWPISRYYLKELNVHSR
jgi:hypothetical protein